MEPSEEDKDKLFFTTTDLLNKINSVIQENQEESSSDAKGGFELQRRLPDGSTRLCTKDEAAAADFQAKLKQVRMFRKNLFVNCIFLFHSSHYILFLGWTNCICNGNITRKIRLGRVTSEKRK